MIKPACSLYSFIRVAFYLALVVTLAVGCQGKNSPTVPGDDLSETGELNNYSSEFGNGLSSGSLATGIQVPDGHPAYYPGEVLVVLNDGIITGSVTLQGWPLRLVEEIKCRWGTVYELEITDGTSVEDMVNRLKADTRVRFAEPNHIYYFDEEPYFPNDPMWASTDDPYDPEDSAYDQWGPTMVGAPIVWNETKGSEDVILAIMDTGIRKDHEDLVDNIWLNEDEIADNGVDDDMNGYIDDTWGWDCWDNDNDPWDDGAYASYHGSACSGVAAAVQDNFRGVSGIAPEISLMAIKVDLTGYGNLESTVVEGMNYAAVNNADIVSMSFGTDQYSEIMEIACEDTWNDGHGVILMASAGNSNSTGLKYPTAYDVVMTIGATVPWTEYLEPMDEKRITSGQDGYYWGSNYGDHLSVMGYGAQYTTTYGGHYDSYWDGGYNGFFGGTSCACPMTAGVMALIRSYFPANSPDWSWERLEQTADDLYTPGFDIQSGHGRVNALRAVYGSDRYAAEQDIYGFVTLELPHERVFDSIHDVPDNPYLDTEDLYRFVTAEDGFLFVGMDIFTWGENLDMALYSDLDLTQLVEESSGANHYYSSFEEISFEVEAGTEYFLRIFSSESGSSTTYGLLVHNASNELIVTGQSIAPGFVHHGDDLVPFLKLDLEIGWSAVLDQVSVFKSGTLPNANFVNASLYKDSNLNGIFDGYDQLLSEEVPPGTNRAIFSGLGLDWDYQHPITLFVVADLSDIYDECTVMLSLESYKDIVTEEGITAHYTQFPITSETVIIGTDTYDPEWPGTVGAQTTFAAYHSITVGWNEAVDYQTPPVKYNIYYTDTLPFDIVAATRLEDVGASAGDGTDLKYKIGNLPGGIEQHFVVRAEDQAGNEEDNLVIVSDTPTSGGDPENPELIETITIEYCYDLCINENCLVTASGTAGLLIYDLTDPTSPEHVSTWSSATVYDASLDGDYVSVIDFSSFNLIDISDPANPVTTDWIEASGSGELTMSGDWAYTVDWYGNVMPIDISDPYDIQAHTPQASQTEYPYDMAMTDVYLYIADYSYGVRALNRTSPSVPIYTNTFGNGYDIGLLIHDDLLYAANWYFGSLNIFDIDTNPADPPLLGTSSDGPGDGSLNVVIRGDYAYMARSDYGIIVFDISDSSNPTYVGDLALYGADCIVTNGELIYVAGDGSLWVVI